MESGRFADILYARRCAKAHRSELHLRLARIGHHSLMSLAGRTRGARLEERVREVKEAKRRDGIVEWPMRSPSFSTSASEFQSEEESVRLNLESVGA